MTRTTRKGRKPGTEPKTNPPPHSKKPQLSDFEQELWGKAVVAVLERKDSTLVAVNLATEIVKEYRRFKENSHTI